MYLVGVFTGQRLLERLKTNSYAGLIWENKQCPWDVKNKVENKFVMPLAEHVVCWY